jgi:hypothetical protein
MRFTPHLVFAHAVLIGTSLIIIGCGTSEREELTERLEKGIAPAHSTDPAERRAVAESLAADVLAPQADPAQTQIETENLQNRISRNCR